MKKFTYLFLILVLLSNIKVFAQENDTNTQVKINSFQMSFITPMGTNGINSWKVTNRVSLNIFAGYAGGLDGVEIGGFSNVIKGDMKGIQLVGYSNVVLGSSNGAQISGFSNVTKKYTKGVQVSGYSNVIADSAEVIQISGYSNVIKGSNKGMQISGFSNYSGGYRCGAQICGFSNVIKGNAKVIQISGFSNVTTKDLTGVQVSSFFNFARKVKGSQIGFINICDSISHGVPIGFFSFVRKGGYHTIEIGGDETFWGQANLKLGVAHFYNIFSMGAKMSSSDIIWGVGYGIGTLMPINSKMSVNLDIISYHVNQDTYYYWYDYINNLNKIKLNVSYKMNNLFTVYGGLTYNIYITDRLTREGNQIDDNIAPWSIYDKNMRVF
jgi:hypothetical protein